MDKNIVLISPSLIETLKELKDYIQVKFENQCSFSIIENFSFSLPKVDLAILDLRFIDFSDEDLLTFTNAIIRQNAIIICSNVNLAKLESAIKYNPSVILLDEMADPTLINASLDRLISLIKRKKSAGKNTYRMIKSDAIKQVEVFPFDLFIKINNEKIIKIYNALDVLQSENIKKYLENDSCKFLVQEKEYNLYLKTLSKLLASTNYLEINMPMISKFKLTGKNLDVAYSIIEPFDFDKENLQIVNQVLEDIYNLTMQYNTFNDFFKSYKEIDCLKKQRVVSIALINSVLVKIFSISDKDFCTLVSAAMFCDFTIRSSNYLNVFNVFSNEYNCLIETEKSSFLTHPADACRAIAKVKGMDPMVQKIIISHEEHPSGKGFPNKLKEDDLDELSTIFIISQKIYYLFANDSEVMTLDHLIVKLREIYTVQDKKYFTKYINKIEEAFNLIFQRSIV